MTDRWIFSFKRTGTRSLDDAELDSFRRIAKHWCRWRWVWGILAVISGLAILLFVVIASSYPLAWIAAIASVVAFFFMLNLGGRADKMGLLFRRAARKGLVDEYVRSERTTEALASYRLATADEEEPPSQPSIFWEADERFEEKIARQIGRQPDPFETPTGDDILITVERVPVMEPIDVPVLDVKPIR